MKKNLCWSYVCLSIAATAQQPAFEVASIKPNATGSFQIDFDASKGRFVAKNILRASPYYADGTDNCGDPHEEKPVCRKRSTEKDEHEPLRILTPEPCKDYDGRADHGPSWSIVE